MTTNYLLHREVDRILAALEPSNRVVCRVMLHTGLRVGDVLAIKTADLAPRMWITERKTGKRKQIGLPAALLRDVREQAGDVWAFPGRAYRDRPEKPRCRQTVWRDIKRAAKLYRIPVNVGTHSLRKVYAVQLRDKYGDIKRVQRALNHGSATTTMIYALADKMLDRPAPARYNRGQWM